MLMHLPLCSQGLAPGVRREGHGERRGMGRGVAGRGRGTGRGCSLPTRCGLPGRRAACQPGTPLRAEPVPSSGPGAHGARPARTQRALVHVLAAGRPRVPRGAGADGLAVHGVGVAVGALVAGVADAGVVEVAQQAWAGVAVSRALPPPTPSPRPRRAEGGCPRPAPPAPRRRREQPALPRDPQGRPAGPAADALPPSSPQKDPFQVVLEDLKATLV